MEKRIIAVGVLAPLAVGVANASELELCLDQTLLNSGEWRNAYAITDEVSIVLSADVKYIPANAFVDCHQLVSLRCESGSLLERVEECAFLGCKSLREIELPDCVSKLGKDAFRDCSALQHLTIPSSVTVLPAHLLSWCVSLRSIILPPRLKSIKQGALQYCRSLQSVELPPSVAEIDLNAMAYCSSLRSIEFPRSVRSLGAYVMSECVSLERAVLPGNDALLGELIFSGCRSLRQLVEPSVKVPRFDCASFIFEPDETSLYEQCVLLVPHNQTARYGRAPGWSLFTHIEEIGE